MKNDRGRQMEAEKVRKTREEEDRVTQTCHIFTSSDTTKATDDIYWWVCRWLRAEKFCLSLHSSVLHSGWEEH